MNEQEIIQKYDINPEQTLDVFYNNGEVWSEGDYSVFHCGEMKVIYQDEVLRTNSDFIKVGLDTDDKIIEADKNQDLYWSMNPWFIVARTDDLDQEEYVTGDIVDAIQYALNLSNVSGQ